MCLSCHLYGLSAAWILQVGMASNCPQTTLHKLGTPPSKWERGPSPLQVILP